MLCKGPRPSSAGLGERPLDDRVGPRPSSLTPAYPSSHWPGTDTVLTALACGAGPPPARGWSPPVAGGRSPSREGQVSFEIAGGRRRCRWGGRRGPEAADEAARGAGGAARAAARAASSLQGTGLKDASTCHSMAQEAWAQLRVSRTGVPEPFCPGRLAAPLTPSVHRDTTAAAGHASSPLGACSEGRRPSRLPSATSLRYAS